RRKVRRPAAKWRRRAASGLILIAALASMGGLYGIFASSSNADNPGANVETGRKLYGTSCITCHGANLQGVTGRGPSLVGVGSAAVYFQVSTGRMPAT